MTKTYRGFVSPQSIRRIKKSTRKPKVSKEPIVLFRSKIRDWEVESISRNMIHYKPTEETLDEATFNLLKNKKRHAKLIEEFHEIRSEGKRVMIKDKRYVVGSAYFPIIHNISQLEILDVDARRVVVHWPPELQKSADDTEYPELDVECLRNTRARISEEVMEVYMEQLVKDSSDYDYMYPVVSLNTGTHDIAELLKEQTSQTKKRFLFPFFEGGSWTLLVVIKGHISVFDPMRLEVSEVSQVRRIAELLRWRVSTFDIGIPLQTDEHNDGVSVMLCAKFVVEEKTVDGEYEQHVNSFRLEFLDRLTLDGRYKLI